MVKIYEQHKRAFRDVSAHAVVHGSDVVATIAFKYPRDGASRLYAYVHWRGSEMVRGVANGGGYDKHTAACADAAKKIGNISDDAGNDASKLWLAFVGALAVDGGQHWHNALRDAGFDVVQVV